MVQSLEKMQCLPSMFLGPEHDGSGNDDYSLKSPTLDQRSFNTSPLWEESFHMANSLLRREPITFMSVLGNEDGYIKLRAGVGRHGRRKLVQR